MLNSAPWIVSLVVLLALPGAALAERIPYAQDEIVRQAWYFKGASSYPWLGMLFCAPIIGLWYWCTDQYIVQRMLGARKTINEDQTPSALSVTMTAYAPPSISIIPSPRPLSM